MARRGEAWFAFALVACSRAPAPRALQPRAIVVEQAAAPAAPPPAGPTIALFVSPDGGVLAEYEEPRPPVASSIAACRTSHPERGFVVFAYEWHLNARGSLRLVEHSPLAPELLDCVVRAATGSAFGPGQLPLELFLYVSLR